MYTIIYFSPTGNSKYLASQLSKVLQEHTTYPIEHTLPSELHHSDHLIIVYAIHAFSAPKPVKSFVKKLEDNQFKNVSLIGVGCNTSWVNQAASDSLRTILQDKFYHVCLDTVVAMPLTLVSGFSDQVNQKLVDDMIQSLDDLAYKIKHQVSSDKNIPLKSHILHYIGKIEPFAAKFFGLELYAKTSCITCYQCINECPSHNINYNKKVKFGFKCMMCMRCIYNCPTQSIAPRLSKFIPIKGGYHLDKYIKKYQ